LAWCTHRTWAWPKLIEQGQWTLGECRSEHLAERYGYVPSPQQQAQR